MPRSVKVMDLEVVVKNSEIIGMVIMINSFKDGGIEKVKKTLMDQILIILVKQKKPMTDG